METWSRTTVYLAPGEGRALRMSDETVTLKVSAEQTGGAYSLFEVVSSPGSGPPPHIQHHEDECLWVLDGEFEVLNNERSFVARPGTLIFVPRGTLHSYKNVGDGPGRMLVSQTPGGRHEGFFEELGEELGAMPVSDGPRDLRRIPEMAARYGIEIPPPATTHRGA